MPVKRRVELNVPDSDEEILVSSNSKTMHVACLPVESSSPTEIDRVVKFHQERENAGGILSFTIADQHDIWAPANDESWKFSKKADARPRVSHFIYSMQFNPDPPAEILEPGIQYLLAVVTAEHLLILGVSSTGTVVDTKKVFVVPDQESTSSEKGEEDLYSLQWVKDPVTRTRWTAVCFGGSSGVLRVVDILSSPCRSAFLRGHAAAINELTYSANFPAFILSASKDHSIRLWTIKYLMCLAVFGGAQGHKAEIITLDMHSSGKFLISGSYDSFIKIWSLFDSQNNQLMDNIRIHGITTNPQPCIISSPLFSVNDVHDRQIDCVRWILSDAKNSLVASKASDETILIWMPQLPLGPRTPGIKNDWQICHKINLKNNKFWFVKFAFLSAPDFILAIGDDLGFIRLYDIYAISAKMKKTSNAVRTQRNQSSSPNKGIIRSVAFSHDGKLMFGGSDDGICHSFRRSLSRTFSGSNREGDEGET